ncbi:MAG TPA: glycosyltransferase family 2 protein [Pyrinomonadaceae bacterium]|nr:glycosyltransferase family 2 protein [Pyrinomonadaceae bacterium]
MPVELAIVIVNWNGGELLRRCLASVAQCAPSLAYEIIIVDNASTDGSRAWLETLGDHVRLIKNEENQGFGRANNQAFAATDAPLLFLLNSDAEVQRGAIDTLIETINSEERIGVVGPRLINPDGTLQASVWRNPVTPFETVANAFRLYKLMPKSLRGRLLLGYHWDHATRRRAELLSGAALLVKRKLIAEVGGFDERFHMYGEDTEWSLRIVRAGWLMIFEPRAVVLHHGGQSARKRWTDLEKRRREYEGFFRFQRLCLSRRLALANLLTGCFVTSTHYLWQLLRGRSVAESKLVLKLHAAELQRTLRPNSREAADSPARVVKRTL